MNISLTKELAEFVYGQMFCLQQYSANEEVKKNAEEVCERIVKGNKDALIKGHRDKIRREMKAEGFSKKDIEEMLVDLNLKEPKKKARKKSRKGGR